MQGNSGLNDRGAPAGVKLDSREIVMGLHWHPPQPEPGAKRQAADLDALCVTFDAEGRVLDTVHPNRTRNENGSIVHTGDSRTGAGAWDDERIFVFLEALPPSVSALEFAVTSANDRVLAEVPGASCHVSDRVSEFEWIRVDLTALGAHRACRVATLRREPGGWRIAADAVALDGAALARLVSPPGNPDACRAPT
ncbi:MAG: tellurium resistance TerZ family protein [Burkholderiales bacterium]|nr:tellurium resistance TerZ family protein [Burkholderiales bacterium]